MTSFLNTLQIMPNDFFQLIFIGVTMLLVLLFLKSKTIINKSLTYLGLFVGGGLTLYFATIRESDGFNLGIMICINLLAISAINVGRIVAANKLNKT